MRAKVLIFILPILAIAQGSFAVHQPLPKLAWYFNQYAQSDGKGISSADEFFAFTQKLERKRGSFKNDRQFLNYLFIKTHQRFLRDFDAYASFRQMTENGRYNCLTGTALYALLLSYFGYDYKVIETNYHIFLLADTGDGKVLFEATDPLQGFVTDGAEIDKRISKYRLNEIQQEGKQKIYYHYQVELFNTVNLDQLLGLMHYNLAIEAYNAEHLQRAVMHLGQAIQLYHSPRIEEFSKIIVLSVMASELEASVKENCVRKIQSMRKQKIPAIASASAYQP